MSLKNKLLQSFSWAGIAVFLTSIGSSIYLYPGGNRFDKSFPQFSFSGNFLCDLFQELAYNGEANRGRHFALLGTYVLALSLLTFWFVIPQLFKGNLKHGCFVRFFGGAAMCVSLFIATRFHDLCIIIAVPLAMIAFTLSIRALFRSGECGIARLGVASISLCIVNYVSLITNVSPQMLPGLQKLTLVLFLSWVISALLRLRRIQTVGKSWS